MHHSKKRRQPGFNDHDTTGWRDHPAHFRQGLIHVRCAEKVVKPALNHGDVDRPGLEWKLSSVADDPGARAILRQDESR